MQMVCRVYKFNLNIIDSKVLLSTVKCCCQVLLLYAWQICTIPTYFEFLQLYNYNFSIFCIIKAAKLNMNEKCFPEAFYLKLNY